MRRLLILLLAISATAFAHPSVSIVVDSKGNAYYSDLKQVWRVDAAGNKTVAVPDVHTHELWLDSADALYGEHLWYTGPQDGSGKWFYRVWKRTPDGRISDVVPATEGFRGTFSFVRDPQGNGYMAGEIGAHDQTIIRVIDQSGRQRVLAGSANKGSRDARGADATFQHIEWLTFGEDGNLYLVDRGTLRRVTRDGVVTTVASVGGKEHELQGLYADRSGNVYVANNGARQVQKFGPDGKMTVFDRSTFPWSPTGVTISGKTAYILEYMNPIAVRLRKVLLK